MEKIHELTNSNLNSGLICAANDRVADSQFSEALTNFASGVRSEKCEALLNFIAPAVRAWGSLPAPLRVPQGRQG